MFRFLEQPHTRREFLRVGGLALGGLSLPALLKTRALAAQAGVRVKDCSVVFLFLHGGPPQTETFDPKMDAPAEVRSVTGEVRTSLPGITFGSTFPGLARLAHKIAVVRSFRPGNENHDLKPLVSSSTGGANIGSIYARLAGANHPRSGIPTNVALFPQAVDPKAQPPTRNFGRFESAGPLGAACEAFAPASGKGFQKDLELSLPRNRFQDRRLLLERLDAARRSFDASGAVDGLDQFRAQAFDLVLRGMAGAFDLSLEDPRIIDRYDTASLVPVETIDKKWNNHKNYRDNAQTLGKLLLLARRLCEAGCGFVTVTTNFVWDFHADVNNATVAEGLRYVGQPFDRAVSAFIEDVEARGLSERILLVACGEMGRTPRLNARGGRDHWGALGPLLLYGGGMRMGQVIGNSTRDAGEPATEPISTDDLIATVLQAQFDLGELRLVPSLPREIKRLVEVGRPIAELAS
jgi:uncharacterized protein (DUF1501 family)